ncbi:transposase [Rhizobium sp. Root708]|uniref:transposase n=1 Tax=Rhizobium sp. Root708 TaxID=1736592 RepID=UPI0012E3F815|nr:transposase [Rhizobium sp. Root708]
MSELALGTGLDRKTVRKILVDQAQKSLLQRLWSTPQVLGVAKCVIGGRTATVFWDVCDRRVIHYIMSDKAADIRRWLEGMPDKGGVVVAVVDMVDTYFNVVAETLPETIVAVNPFLIRRRMLEIGSELLSKSPFKAFKKTDPYFLSFKSFAGFVNRPSSILEVNPYLRQAFAVRRAFHRIWTTRDRTTAARALEQFLSEIPKVLRRSYPDVVKAVERWHERLADSVDIPGLSRYTTGRSILGSALPKTKLDGDGGAEIHRRPPFDDESFALCHVCMTESRRWSTDRLRTPKKPGGRSPKTSSVVRMSCSQCNCSAGR